MPRSNRRGSALGRSSLFAVSSALGGLPAVPTWAAVAVSILSLVGCDHSAESDSSPPVALGRASALTAADWVTVPSVADPAFTGLTIPVDAPTKGMWSATQTWPMNALHATLLPHGTVLTF